MKKILTLAGLILSSFAFGQNPDEKIRTSEVVSLETAVEKGPKFKNQRAYVNSGKSELVRSGKNDRATGPKYKNERNYSVAGVGKVKVVSYNLQGPEYKNKRF